MPWETPTLRARREEVRDDINGHVEGADARVPNSVLRYLGDAIASQTHDNDAHLAHLVRVTMPDTAEGEFVDRWANVWLPEGRKAAAYAKGTVTVTGAIGGTIATGARLRWGVTEYQVPTGITLTATSQTLTVEAVTPGAAGNADAGASLSFLSGTNNVDAGAVVVAPGFAGGADQETDADLIARYIDRIQQPPHGGAKHDYPAWALELAGVTRAWLTQEMGPGTVTLRFMLDTVRAAQNGVPTAGDIALMETHIDTERPVTVMDRFIVAPVAVPLDLTISELGGDTPETRAAIDVELETMLRFRAQPGGTIYASWIREAISIATGEDYHKGTFADVVPANAGEIIVPGTVTYA